MAERLAGGNVAVALLGNTLAMAAMLLVPVSVLGPVSGAHLVAQLAGACLAGCAQRRFPRVDA